MSDTFYKDLIVFFSVGFLGLIPSWLMGAFCSENSLKMIASIFTVLINRSSFGLGPKNLEDVHKEFAKSDNIRKSFYVFGLQWFAFAVVMAVGYCLLEFLGPQLSDTLYKIFLLLSMVGLLFIWIFWRP